MASMQSFSEPARTWFRDAFSAPTPVQTRGWQAIASHQHALLVAPTGSGKTLAAFLWGIDKLARLEPDATAGVRRARPFLFGRCRPWRGPARDADRRRSRPGGET